MRKTWKVRKLTGKDYAIFLIALLALAGVASVLFATKLGIGITWDSTVYIGAARNMLDGKGFSVTSASGKIEPVTHFSPLFTVALSVIGSFGVAPLVAARWLNALLFAANIIMVGFVINSYTGGSIRIAAFASLLMLTSVDMLNIHSMAWSEPMFIFWGLLGLLVLARYAGIAFIAAGVIAVLFLGKKGYYEKARNAVIFAVISFLPLALWMTRNKYSAGTAMNRVVGFHPPVIEHVKSALDTFSMWLLPESIAPVGRVLLTLIIGIFLFGLTVVLLRRQKRQRGGFSVRQFISTFPCVLVIFIIVYLCFLLLSVTFADANTLFDGRIMSPIYVCGIALIPFFVHSLLCATKGVRIIRLVFFIFAIVFTGSYLCRGVSFVANRCREGSGYASKNWQTSALIQEIRALPSGIPIYSNGPDAIQFFTGKSASMIPRKVDIFTRKINDNYLSQLDSVREQLREDDGILVYFNTMAWRSWYLPSEKELVNQLSLSLQCKAADGAIYKVGD